MNLKLNFNGKTLLKDWWRIMLENLQSISSYFETHRTASTLDHPDRSVQQRHMANSSVGTNQLIDLNVTEAKLASGAVTSAKIGTSAVQTTHIKDSNVTKPKLEQSLRLLLNSFEEHMNTPSQEIADNSVTWNKLNEIVQMTTRNYMNDADTYNYCNNDFANAWNSALAYSFNSNRGSFRDAPPDNTPMPQGMIRYAMFVTRITTMTMLQIAINLSSLRVFIRILTNGTTGGWQEMGVNNN